jgi:amino acid adenylation domain-containing protein
METVTALLTDLRKKDVRVWLDQGKLRLSAPKGGLSPSLQAQLSEHKAAIISFLERSQRPVVVAPELRPIARTGRMPLSFSQERLWFLNQFDPASPSYNIIFNIPMSGAVPVPLIERTLTEIVRRHETLRTTFELVDAQPVAVIHPPAPMHVRVVDLSRLTQAEREREALRIRKQEAATGFDLAKGPLFRGILFQLGPQQLDLLLTKHHIISDGWSLALLVDEFRALLPAFILDQPSPLPELPIQYVDYATWQREWLSGPSLEHALAYWKKQLGGRLPVLELPTDRPRPPVQTFNGALQMFALPKRLTDGLNALCREEGATQFMALLAVYKLLLSRYSGQEDILVGTTNGSRSRVEVEKLIGFFINTLVLRTNLAGDLTFRQLLRRVSAVVLEALAHQDMPFEKLVEALQPQRDLSHSPLFQAFFILQNSPLGDLTKEAAAHSERTRDDVAEGPQTRDDIWDTHVVATGSGHRLVVETGTAKFDFTLFAVDSGRGLTGNIEYNTDLFDHATIGRILDYFESLLQAVVDAPDEPLSRIVALPGAERRFLLRELNATAAPYPAAQCLHELIAARAAEREHQVAVTCHGESLTYGELERRANQLAHRLREQGVGPGHLVGVRVDRSVRMVVALLGVLKAGGAYVPLDPAFPHDRTSYMIEDAEVSVLLTERAYADDVSAGRAAVLYVDDPAIYDGRPDTAPVNAARPEDLAYVIYTSGSTGRPKGVQISHRAVVNFLASMAQTPGLSASDVLVSVTTLSFDIAGLELYLPLTVGARVVIATRSEAGDAARLAALLDEHGATVLQATPATWRLLLDAGWPGRKTLRMYCGGEPLPADLAGALLERGEALWNLYGPTETTIWSTASQVTDASAITIGRPIANTEIYILNRDLQPAPLGATGELYIGGDGLARGYLKRPELTAERFVPHPFSEQIGARLYRTGDVARYLPDGRIQCLGRVDHQVKIRGFRIELGEIETALATLPDVRSAVVHVHEDASGDRRLVAYVIPADAPPTVSALRTALKETLPEYMVPSLFEFLTAFPLTPNGKVDRKALPAPSSTRPELTADCILPRNAVEQRVGAIWQEVLGVPRVGVRDNFFDLGGHSLLVIKVHVKLQQAFDREISIVDMFRLPTIEALAQHLAKEPGGRVSFGDAQQRAAQRRAAPRPRQVSKGVS